MIIVVAIIITMPLYGIWSTLMDINKSLKERNQ
jgi:hypothetical protein